MRSVISIAVDDLFAVEHFRNTFGVEIQTPNMDRLAAMGVSFENAFASTALCNPSRTSILTGQSPFTTGVHFNADPWYEKVDPAQTLPALFKAAGYSTWSYGKNFHVMSEAVSEQLLNEHSDQVQDEPQADVINIASAVARLESLPPTDPFFMMVGLHDPHGYWHAEQQYLDLYPQDQLTWPDWNDYTAPEFMQQYINSREYELRGEAGLRELIQGYLAEITQMDARLGVLLDAIEASDQEPLIALWGDHGYSLGDHDHVHKFTLWDQAGRAPLIIVDPLQSANAGETHTGVVSLLDLAPTLLDMAGLTVPTWMEGRSLEDVIGTPTLDPNRAVLTTMFGSVSVRTDLWRLTRYEDGSYEMFNIRRDPHNVVNVVDDPRFASVREHLETRMELQLERIGVVFDDDLRTLTYTERGTDNQTYFVNEHSDTSQVVDETGTDTIVTAQAQFILPSWAENFTSSSQFVGANVQGNSLGNLVVSTPNADVVQTLAGDDVVEASRGDDVVNVGPGNDKVRAGHGNDRVMGMAGNDTLSGGFHRDALRGDAGDDFLWGENGADRLFGGTGNDTLSGGREADIFVVGVHAGDRDAITDFTREVDTVLLQGDWSGATLSESGGHTVLTLDSQRLTLLRVTGLTMDDFDFAP